jgi:hypothetical protein
MKQLNELYAAKDTLHTKLEEEVKTAQDQRDTANRTILEKDT